MKKLSSGIQQCNPCVNMHLQGLETKSGQLYMIQKYDNKTCKIQVTVRVYRKDYGQYAIVTPDKAYTNKSVYMNLRNSTVRKNDPFEFTVIAGGADGHHVTFRTTQKHETEDWIAVMQTPNTCRLQRGNKRVIRLVSRNKNIMAMPSVRETNEELSQNCDVLDNDVKRIHHTPTQRNAKVKKSLSYTLSGNSFLSNKDSNGNIAFGKLKFPPILKTNSMPSVNEQPEDEI